MTDESPRANDQVPYGRGVQAGDEEVAAIADATAAPPTPGREHFFDAFLTCEHPQFDVLVGDLLDRVTAVSGPRKRALKAKDAETLFTLIGTIAANLAYAVLAGFSPPTVAVPLRQPEKARTRYERAGFRQIGTVVKNLAKAGVVVLETSRERGRASTINPTPRFTELLSRLDGLDLTRFGNADDRETIVLSRNVRSHFNADDTEKELIDYRDTAETIVFRAEMAKINAYLAAADIGFAGPLKDSFGRQLDTAPRARFLWRSFNVPPVHKRSGQPVPPVPDDEKRFDRGGRLSHAGIFWQCLAREDRSRVRIDGETTAYLDFQSMFLRLALLDTGVTPPEGDLYRQIEGIVTEDDRDGIKTVLNAMLSRTAKSDGLPRNTGPLLPKELRSGKTVKAAILAAFPALAGSFGKGRGLALMFAESQTMVAILLRLADERITALPIHDGLMVAASKADRAETLIDLITNERHGVVLPLSRK